MGDCERLWKGIWKTNTILSYVIYDVNSAGFYLHLTRVLINFNKICARWYNTTQKNALYSLFYQSQPISIKIPFVLFFYLPRTVPCKESVCLSVIRFPLTQNTNRRTVKTNKYYSCKLFVLTAMIALHLKSICF